ncbi:MAG: cobalamin biosynthesis protein [Beijerinckiaceae bacterium]|nr:cobalamin biosynthesis protein [Beijerinckiaceae bacterium]
MIAIGAGCRKGCPADEIIALIRAALETVPGEQAQGLFTIDQKRGEPGLEQAAAALDLPLVFVGQAALQNVAADATFYSHRIEDMYGLPSIAETAALAGAGDGAVLLVTRRASARATCAIARTPA